MSSSREEETVADDESSPVADAEIAKPAKVGRYVVLDLIGFGGMGVVCTAFDPKLDRKIALKLLRDRPGDTDGSMATAGQARLFREAQALAKLSHPNVIAVHDVDTYQGQLYIAMEYVEGGSLKEWMRAEKRPWKDVVRVFVEAGRGLAAAHEAGLLHRDFKPGNVLLGDDGRVRVVDFGLAKNVHAKDDEELEKVTPKDGKIPTESGVMDAMRSASEMTLTQAGRTVGTPAYMSPEQHLGLPVTAHGDQFSFCVSLYQALYAELPFRGNTVEEQFKNTLQGNVAEPSDRGQVPAWVHRIVLRGLSPRAEERFRDMRGLLAALENDPARRRKRWALIGVAVSGVLAGGVGIYGAKAAARNVCAGAEDRFVGAWDRDIRESIRAAFLATGKPFAQDAFAGVERTLDGRRQTWTNLYTQVCEATHVHGEQSESLLDARMACLRQGLEETRAITTVLASADASVVERAVSAVAGLADLSVCESLDPSDEHRLPDDPAVRSQVEAAQVDIAQAKALTSAGRYADAVAAARAATQVSAELPHAPTHVRAILQRGTAEVAAGELESAEASVLEAIALAAKSRQNDQEFEAWNLLLGLVGNRLHRHDEAGVIATAAEAAVARAGSRPVDIAAFKDVHGSVLMGMAKHEDGIRAHEESLAIVEELHGSDSLQAAGANADLATALAQTGKFEEARPKLERALETREKLLGSKHPENAVLQNNLGNIFYSLDQYAEAREHYEKALAIRKVALSSNHPQLGDSLLALGLVDAKQDKFEQARQRYEQALAIWKVSLPADHPKVAIALNNIGKSFRGEGEPGRAREHHRAALAIYEKKLGKDHPRLGNTLQHLCDAYADEKRFEEALTACGRARRIFEAKYGKEHTKVAGALAALGLAKAAVGRTTEGISDLDRALEIHAVAGSSDLRVGVTKVELAKVLWKVRRRRSEAIRVANQALELLERGGHSDEAEETKAWLAKHR